MSKALPIVAAVMDARRPNMQENGREIARAPDPILPACTGTGISNPNSLEKERRSYINPHPSIGVKFLTS